MNRNVVLLPLVFVLSCLLVTPVLAETGPAPFPPSFLSGNRVNLSLGNQYVPHDQPHYVMHGFVIGDWHERSPAERQDLLRHFTFELFIEDEPVELRRWQCRYQTYDAPAQGPLDDAMLVVFSASAGLGQRV